MTENIVAAPQMGGGTEFIENLHTDEIRSGFLVTSHRKKLWNVQIGLINEFARICKKHNLRWFAYAGTMLGAARHKGFVPWDDDIDLVMLRPDYDKFLKVAAEEIKYPYYLDHFYDYRRADEENSSPDEEKFPLVDLEKGWPFFCSFAKLRDDRTTFIVSLNKINCPQGIYIDIFPFDPVPPFNDNKQMLTFNMNGVLYATTFDIKFMHKFLENTQMPQFLQDFFKLTFRQRGITYDKFASENFFLSEYVGRIFDFAVVDTTFRYKAADFDDVIYLPFEKIELPAPANYDEHLKILYGDWHKFEVVPNHAKYFSADIPYDECFKKIDQSVLSKLGGVLW